MGYEIDNVIAAADVNAFLTQLDLVYGVGTGDSGYGQTTFSLATVTVDDTVQSAEWSALVQAAEACANHQDSSINMPPTSEVAVGQLVEAHEADPPTSDPFDIDSSLNTLTANRLQTAVSGAMTLFTNFLQDSRGTAWSVGLDHIFTMVFPTVDDARFFFNSGGEIRMRGSRSGGSATSQNADWTALLSSLSAGVVFGANATTAPVGTPAAIGYFQLTASFQQIFTVNSGDVNYITNDITIFARTQDGPQGPNGDTGRFLEFRIEYNDDHVNAFADSVDGTITSDIDLLQATGFLTITAPTPTTTTSLTAGS